MSDWFKLEHLGALAVRGVDAEAFAQSQFTADMAQLALHRWSPLAWCDPRGRVIAVMLAARRDELIELVLPRRQVEPVSQKLPVFAIGRKVEVTVPGGVVGQFEYDTDDNAIGLDPGRGMLIGIGDARVDADALHAWKSADLACALPWLAPETSGRYLPQMLGLEALDGLSFRKGCFPGQEVVARARYLGKVKRRLAGIVIDQSIQLRPGDRILDEEGASIGEVLWNVTDPDRTRALAVVKSGTNFAAPAYFIDPSRQIHARVTIQERLC